jgi:hypothetical protein
VPELSIFSRTFQANVYQVLTYKGDVDLEKKLAERENFHNYRHLHGAFAGTAPQEALVERPG